MHIQTPSIFRGKEVVDKYMEPTHYQRSNERTLIPISFLYYGSCINWWTYFHRCRDILMLVSLPIGLY